MSKTSFKRRLNILSLALPRALWCCLCCTHVIFNRVEPPLKVIRGKNRRIMVPWKKGLRGKNPWKEDPRKDGPRENGTRKNGPRRNGPRKNLLKKLFSVKRMLGNSKDFFIFIDRFHYTHIKMFDVHLTILHAPNCRTLNASSKVCYRVLAFYRLITSQLPAHTPRCSTLTPRFFVSEFWVCFGVSGLLSSFGFS